MELSGIRQTSQIAGVKRNPNTTENGKVPVWNNVTQFFDYSPYWGGAFNTKTADGIVNKGDDGTAGYTWKLDSNKNPFWRKEDFLVSALRSGNSAVFTMNDSTPKTLPLGALAWVDSVPAEIALPGDQKILFDDNNTIGGDIAFKYNKTTKTIDLTGFTGIQVKNGIDSTLKGAFQYLGRKNILIGHGTTKTIAWAANMEGNLLEGEGAGGSLVTGSWNLMSGTYSGANVSSNVSRSVFLGPYSGRLESDSDKLHIGNINYASQELARLGSLLYGDFATGWLRINNRLEVGQEARIGTFDVANTPSWGMLQFVGTGTTDEYKPQYHDGFNWVDFATGANNYLSAVTKATADVGTTDAAYQATFVRNGLPDLTIQLGSNAFNSLPIPKALPEATYGFLQVSSGNTNDGNRGFTYSTSLSWSEANKRLSITGDVRLSATTLTGATLGNIKFDGLHYYGYGRNDSNTANEWRRLDEVGSSATSGVDTTDPRIVITPNPSAGTNDFSLDWNPAGSYITPVTVKTYSGGVYGGWITGDGIAPEIKLKKIISDTIQFIENGDELIAEVTGVGGGESNAAENVGTGIGLYKDKVSGSLRFKSVRDAGTHVSVVENADGLHVDFDVADITLTNIDIGIPAITQDLENSFAFAQRGFVSGLATTAVEGLGIHFDVNKAIPMIAPTPTMSPEFAAGGTPGQGTLSFSMGYSGDIRTSPTITQTSFHSFLIGSGLYYNPITKTLSALNSAGSPSDYALTSISRNINTLNFLSTDEYGSAGYVSTPFTFGSLAFLDDVVIPIATYIDNVAPTFGGVLINKSVKTTPYNILQSFTLNEVTGELEFTVEPVLLTPQYDLYDGDNVAGDNIKRGIARSNIGAAYINGRATENFVAKDSESDNLIVNTLAVIQNVEISGTQVTSDATVGTVELAKANAGVAASKVEVTPGGINVYLNANQGAGNFNIYSIDDAGTPTAIFRLDSSGNIIIKGQLIALDTTIL